MILAYGGLVPTSCSSCSWKWKWNSSSSIYQQRRQQKQQHQERLAFAICRINMHESSRNITTSVNSCDLLGDKPITPSTLIGSIKTTIVVAATVAVSTSIMILIMFSVMSPNSDAAAEIIAVSSTKQQQLSRMKTDETLLDVPQTLSSQDGGYCSFAKEEDCKKRPRIQRPKSRKAESCTIKCVTTCIRGGGGSPGEGPLNVRRPLVVFKAGFRSRQYCLIECSDICNLINEGDSGP